MSTWVNPLKVKPAAIHQINVPSATACHMVQMVAAIHAIIQCVMVLWGISE